MSPFVVNVSPAKAAGAETVETFVATVSLALATVLRLAPSALATAMGSEDKPGLISAASVTNFRTVLTVSPGAAITAVETALGVLADERVVDATAAAVQGAVTVIYPSVSISQL